MWITSGGEREILRVQKRRRAWQREIWRNEDRVDMWEGKYSKGFQLKTTTSPQCCMHFILNWGRHHLPVMLYLIAHTKYSNTHQRINGGNELLDEGIEAPRVLTAFVLVHLSLYLWEKLVKTRHDCLPICPVTSVLLGSSCIERFEYDKLLIKVLKLVIKKGLSRECSNSAVEKLLSTLTKYEIKHHN